MKLEILVVYLVYTIFGHIIDLYNMVLFFT